MCSSLWLAQAFWTCLYLVITYNEIKMGKIVFYCSLSYMSHYFTVKDTRDILRNWSLISHDCLGFLSLFYLCWMVWGKHEIQDSIVHVHIPSKLDCPTLIMIKLSIIQDFHFIAILSIAYVCIFRMIHAVLLINNNVICTNLLTNSSYICCYALVPFPRMIVLTSYSQEWCVLFHYLLEEMHKFNLKCVVCEEIHRKWIVIGWYITYPALSR